MTIKKWLSKKHKNDYHLVSSFITTTENKQTNKQGFSFYDKNMIIRKDHHLLLLITSNKSNIFRGGYIIRNNYKFSNFTKYNPQYHFYHQSKGRISTDAPTLRKAYVSFEPVFCCCNLGRDLKSNLESWEQLAISTFNEGGSYDITKSLLLLS